MGDETAPLGLTNDWQSDIPTAGHHRWHLAVVVCLVLVVTAAHWWTPRDHHSLHVVHVALRKLYILPVVMAAVWFNLRLVLLVALAVTLLYLPHVAWQWSGQFSENVNQVGEIVTIWVTAVLTATFVGREKTVLRRLARAYEGGVQALVAALDAREHHTEQHSIRVRAYTLRLAAQLRIQQADRRVYALGALLHDVGKIGAPDSILLKPGPLTDNEWKQIKQHPAIGKKILSSAPFLHEATQIVYAHHEMFDGTGYPLGLSGPEIPLEARLFAVADVFDALTSDRPYKRSLSYQEARLEIESGAGTHFDPKVVEAFLNIPKQEWDRIRNAIGDNDGSSPLPKADN